MKVKKLQYEPISNDDMARASDDYLDFMRTRRSVREFSSRNIPIEVLKNIVSTAASAPSGANKEPWNFTMVKDPDIKRKIRIAAEIEEKAFYTLTEYEKWKLKDLKTSTF